MQPGHLLNDLKTVFNTILYYSLVVCLELGLTSLRGSRADVVVPVDEGFLVRPIMRIE